MLHAAVLLAGAVAGFQADTAGPAGAPVIRAHRAAGLIRVDGRLDEPAWREADNETDSFGSNTRLRWTFDALGDLFVVYNHNLREVADRWEFGSNQLLVKAQYAWRF